jgi:hypothetical protein
MAKAMEHDETLVEKRGVRLGPRLSRGVTTKVGAATPPQIILT